MIRWIRRHPVLTIIGLLLMPLTVRGALNLTGFCWKEKRYVPLEEKCEAALRHVYKYYPPHDFKIEGAYVKEIKRHVQYKDFDDFFRRNRDGCRLVDDFAGGKPPIGFFGRLFGYGGGVIRVEYAADADGIEPAARFLRERWGIFNISYSREIDKNIKNIFRELWRRYNKKYFDIRDQELEYKEKYNSDIFRRKYRVLYDEIRKDFDDALKKLSYSDRKEVLDIYNKNKLHINLRNSWYVMVDNCGRVWDPFD